MTEPTSQPTKLPNLRGMRLSDVRTDEDLQPHIDDVLAQVEAPRYNLGGSAPPGRAD